MSNTQPKGLFTSLVLFITLGLFSLATLFTVLILEVRTGQQQLSHQLGSLTGDRVTTSQISPPSSAAANIEQLNQLQATLDLIVTRQRTHGASELSSLSKQMDEVRHSIEQLQERIAQLPAPPTQLELPAALSQPLQQIQQAQNRQQQQYAVHEQQLSTLLTQQQEQQKHSARIAQQIKAITNRPKTTPDIDLSALDQITLALEQIHTTQQQLNITQQQKPKNRDHSLNEIGQKLNQLMKQQEKIHTTQRSIVQSVQEIPLNTPTPSALPSNAVIAQLKQLATAQHNLQVLVENIAQQQSSQPRQQKVATTPPQLELMNSQLEQLKKQQQLIERNILKSREQSNTIKPYSYNAR